MTTAKNNTIVTFLNGSFDSGNVPKARFSNVKLDTNDKSKDAKRVGKVTESIKHELSIIVSTLINRSHSELLEGIKGNARFEKVSRQSVIEELTKAKTYELLPVTAKWLLARIRKVDVTVTMTDKAIFSAVAVAVKNYKAFTASATKEAEKVGLSKNADFGKFLKETTFSSYQQKLASLKKEKTEKPKASVVTA